SSARASFCALRSDEAEGPLVIVSTSLDPISGRWSASHAVGIMSSRGERSGTLDRAAGPAPASRTSDSHGRPGDGPNLRADFSDLVAGQVSSTVSKPRQRNHPSAGRLASLRVPDRFTGKQRSVFPPDLTLASRSPTEDRFLRASVRHTNGTSLGANSCQ